MRCGKTDCVHFGQGHPACEGCWRSKSLHDHYEPRSPYSDQGRICNLLGRAWDTYCLSGLTKRRAVLVLAHIQRAQELVMQEEEMDTEAEAID